MTRNCKDVSSWIDAFGNFDLVKCEEFLDFIVRYPTGLDDDSSLDPEERSKYELERIKYDPCLVKPILDPTPEAVAVKILAMLDQWQHRSDCQLFIPAINDYLTCLRGELHELGIHDLPHDKLFTPTLLEVIEAKDNDQFDELWKQYNNILHLALKSVMGTEGNSTATATAASATETKTKTHASRGKGDADTTADSDAMRRVVGFYTGGVADEKMRQAELVIQNRQLSANDKIEQLNRLIPFNPTMTAEQIGKLIGVSKQAAARTQWWRDNREGEKQNQIGRRRAVMQSRAKQHQPDFQQDDEE